MPVVGNPRPAGDSSEVYYAKNKTYLRGRQLQHHYNTNSFESRESSSCSYSDHDCSSEVTTLFQYISQNIEELGQSLVQRQHQ